MKKILITGGASGFIGNSISKYFSKNFKVITYDKNLPVKTNRNFIVVKGCITDENKIESICKKYSPDVIIHCAGINYQNIFGKNDADAYDKINSIATEKIAFHAAKANPGVKFIFLSTISVYGEAYNKKVVKETYECKPTSIYAESKLNAENRLRCLYDDNIISNIDILRLAPVYDLSNCKNVEKRVFGFKKQFYVKFGSGDQKMSILARSNLLDFIDFRLRKNNKSKSFNIINVCDLEPVKFNEIINIFQKSKYQPDKLVVNVPLILVRIVTMLSGLVLINKQEWINSFYDKLANDFVFDNQKMLDTGFMPKHTLKSEFIK